MSDSRKSFVLYTDYQENILLLSREQRGDLLTLIMAYASGDTLPEVDGMTQMAFSFIKSRMDKDSERYSEVIEKRREAGKQGGRPKANGSGDKAKKANGFSEKQSEAKKPDNDLDSDNVFVNDKDKNKRDIVPPFVRKSVTTFSEESFEMNCVNALVQSCLSQFQGANVPGTFEEKQKWCIDIDRMKRLDNRTETEIQEALKFATTDSFWKTNIRSAGKLREKFETLLLQSRDKGNRKTVSAGGKPKNGFHNLEQHGYDYDKMVQDINSSTFGGA